MIRYKALSSKYIRRLAISHLLMRGNMEASSQGSSGQPRADLETCWGNVKNIRKQSQSMCYHWQGWIWPFPNNSTKHYLRVQPAERNCPDVSLACKIKYHAINQERWHQSSPQKQKTEGLLSDIKSSWGESMGFILYGSKRESSVRTWRKEMSP